MADINFHIPVVDFEKFSLNVKETDVKNEDISDLADKICEVFKTSGFVYIKNHGISQSKMLEMQRLARQFFTLPTDVKQKYSRPGPGIEENYGWTTLEREIVNPNRPGDLKETYDIMPRLPQKWPDEVVPGFQSFMMQMFEACSELCNRLHYLMGVGLKLQDTELFRKNHNPLASGCSTSGRLLYYPVVADGELKEKQLWCGEHTDYGSITLLIQDDVGGLEVMNKKGEFVPATPIPGTIVVNVADLMQRWTSDQLVSTVHRVVTPAGQKGHKEGRISFAYFAQPDDECLIECIDGSNKYEPVKSGNYLDMRLSSTYAY